MKQESSRRHDRRATQRARFYRRRAVRAETIPRLLEPNSENANAVVAVNPALMDAKLPRYAPQVIAVRITTDDLIGPNSPSAWIAKSTGRSLKKCCEPSLSGIPIRLCETWRGVGKYYGSPGRLVPFD